MSSVSLLETGKKCWYLSCCETVIHVIPGLGAITSTFKWGVSQIQIQQLQDPDIELYPTEKAALAINSIFCACKCCDSEDEDLELTNRPITKKKENDPESQQAQINEIECASYIRKFNILSGKSSNRGRIAMINSFISLFVLGTTLGSTLWHPK